MSCGDSAWNSGLKPLNSTVRSSAGDVFATGMVSPLASSSPLSVPCWASEM